MGICHSSAIQCAATDTSEDTGIPTKTIEKVAVVMHPVRQISQHSAVVNSGSHYTRNSQNELQVDQSEHSVCIRLDLQQGTKSVLLTLPVQQGSTNSRQKLPNEKCYDAKTASPVVKPDEECQKDVAFKAKHGEQDAAFSASSSYHTNRKNSPSRRHTLQDHLDHKDDLRQNVLRRPQAFCQPPHAKQASKKKVLRCVPHTKKSGLKKENSWYHLGYYDVDSSPRSVGATGAYSQSNRSLHRRAPPTSSDTISLEQSLRSQESHAKPNKKATVMVPLEVSMNDVSGNTLPTQVDYDDRDDDISDTDDDDELNDYLWNYQRNIKALTKENYPINPTCTKADLVESDPVTLPLSVSSTMPFTSSNHSCSQSADMSRQRYLQKPLLANVHADSESAVNTSYRSILSCQSDSYYIIRSKKKSSPNRREKLLQPWNPHSLPSF